ncbi:MAG TPA: hypothetical protein VJS45_07195 [Acidimicrobiia bacterium]|nr:hypothetical protein [Acidimicrobiia bacterium]
MATAMPRRGKMQMRGRFVLTAALALVAMAFGFTFAMGSAVRAEGVCSLETMRGSYALGGAGLALGSPWAGAGRIVLDGAGRLTGNVVEVYGGVIDDAGVQGTYSLNPDCRGFLTIDTKHDARVGGQAARWKHETHRVEFFVAAGGQRVSWVIVDTYPVQQPGGLPDVADPSITINGYLERM